MPTWSRLAIGLFAVLLLGWIYQGPLGHGHRFIGSLETQARAAVAETNLGFVKVAMGRSPLRRVAILSGPANDLQRNGIGSYMGVTGRVEAVPGIAQVR